MFIPPMKAVSPSMIVVFEWSRDSQVLGLSLTLTFESSSIYLYMLFGDV